MPLRPAAGANRPGLQSNVSLPIDRRHSILCAGLTVVAVLATHPSLEMGLNDDWSYTWVARELAATGRFTYNGWIGAIIGVQAVWAAVLIKLFGFSFTLVRLSTLPFAAGCASLLYSLSRRAGLNPAFALFGTLSVTLSPVFIPVAASFMTDVPGCFFWLAAIYCSFLAVETGATVRAFGWMALAAVAGVAGGTVRQVVWFAPLLTLPAVALIRKERSVVMGAGLPWCATAAAMWLCLRWFNAQPYGFTPTPYEMEPWLDLVRIIVESVLQIAVACLLLVIPVLALYLAAWRKWIRTPIQLTVGLLGAGALLASVWLFGDSLLLGNIITPTGVLGPGLDLLGTKPVVLTVPIRCLLGAALIATTGVTAAMLFGNFPPVEVGIRRLAVLLVPACMAYTVALVYRSVTEWILFDRYMILLMPLVIIPVLWHFQRRVQETPPAWGWVIVGLFALYGIATTHDYLAACRARLQAATAVTAAGIPRMHVSAGLEYDGWTQLEQTGRIPSPAEQEAASPRRYPVSPPYWYWAKTPAVDPVYVVAYSPVAGLMDSQFPPVEFTAWLPPFHRRVFTHRAPE